MLKEHSRSREYKIISIIIIKNVECTSTGTAREYRDFHSMCKVPRDFSMCDNGVVEVSYCMSDSETSNLAGFSYRKAVSTLHVALEYGSDLHVNERQKIQHYRGRPTEEE